MDFEKGKLYIVSTPIGNLKDMTFRAIETLKEAHIIAAEDTRHTRELLNHFEIKTKLTSYHEHNKYEKAKELISLLNEGQNIALVTDAGTPIISDPGEVLVSEAIKENIIVTAIPGACAAINALVLSGITAKSFTFVGFLSDDKKHRKAQLEKCYNETNTMIFYISPHSIKKDIDDLILTFSELRNATICREMTKKFEEINRGTLKELKEIIEERVLKGELVLVVEGLTEKNIIDKDKEKWQHLTISEHVKFYIDDGYTEKEAMKKVAIDRGITKRDVYKEYKVGGKDGE